MAYTSTNLTKLSALQQLAQRAEAAYAKKTELEALQKTVDGIVETGGEANVIDGVSVNGVAATVTDKVAEISVPTKTSEITNDSGYQTGDEVSAAIQTAIAATGHASFEVVDAVPSADEAEENILYLVKNADTGYYDIYALVGTEVVLLDDTTVDLSGYTTTEALNAALASYATAESVEEGLAEKVDTADIASDEEVAEMLDEIYGAAE